MEIHIAMIQFFCLWVDRITTSEMDVAANKMDVYPNLVHCRKERRPFEKWSRNKVNK